MPENQRLALADSIQEARQRIASEFCAQAQQILKLNSALTELQQLHGRAEQEASRQWDEITRVATLVSEQQASAEKAIENVLGAVRALMTCTIPEQVFEILTEEAAQWGVRAAIFDVRGKSAWGAAASGFGPEVTAQVFRGLIVPLNQDSPFRQVCETAGTVDTSAGALKKNRNLLDKLKPAPHAPILLVPVRSAGTVAAIFYADQGEGERPLPVNALKILAEFAGAQVDRLIALSGGFSSGVAEEEATQAAPPQPVADEAPVEVGAAAPSPVGTSGAELGAVQPTASKREVEQTAPEASPEEMQGGDQVLVGPAAVERAAEQRAVEPPVVEETAAEVHAQAEGVAPERSELEPPVALADVAEELPAVIPLARETESALPVAQQPVEEVPPLAPLEFPAPAPDAESTTSGEDGTAALAPTVAAELEISQLSEAEQKLHKDAKRFAKLLVSEIELYNKSKVAEGRLNRDLYRRLKADIDRSRQTFEKRFGKTLSKQFAYFHEELVRILAANDPSALGPEYPGPAE